MAQSIITTENLCKSFGDPVVKMVNLDVNEGEIYGLVGPTGSGKTTTLLLISGYYSPTAGKVCLYGKEAGNNLSRHKRHFGFLSERTGFYEMMTARENLELFAGLYRLGKEESKNRVDTLLEYAGLTSVAQKQVSTLTPGMVQRLGLAKALIHQPEILILDEPLAQMDLQGIQLIRQTIQLWAKEGRTVLFSSHYFASVLEVCTTIGVMIDGELVYQGAPIEFMAELKDSYHKYRVQFEHEGRYCDESILNGMALVEYGVQVLNYDYDTLVIACPFQEGDLRRIFEMMGVAVKEIRSLNVSDEELFYHYCAQYQDLKELTEGGGSNDECSAEIVLDGFPVEDAE